MKMVKQPKAILMDPTTLTMLRIYVHGLRTHLILGSGTRCLSGIYHSPNLNLKSIMPFIGGAVIMSVSGTMSHLTNFFNLYWPDLVLQCIADETNQYVWTPLPLLRKVALQRPRAR
jgi:hypothetical protein